MRSVRKSYLPPERIIYASTEENQSSVLEGFDRRFRTACEAAPMHVVGLVHLGWRKVTRVASSPSAYVMGVAQGQTLKSIATESLRRHAHHGTSEST